MARRELYSRMARGYPLGSSNRRWAFGVESGVLDGAWRNYGDDWLPRSRGADDALLADAYSKLEERGFVKDGKVNDAGIAHRIMLEEKRKAAVLAWQYLGEERTTRFVELVDSVGDELMRRIDETAW